MENPLVSVITSISFDHMHILGNTLEEIAMEKFGIVKKGVPVVISKQTEEISDLLVNECIKIGSPYYAYDKQWKYIEHENNCVFEGIFKMLYTPYPTIEGDYQVINAGTAIAALLAQNKLFVSDEAIRNGIKNMTLNYNDIITLE
jgi:dihydrofolate synthase/folylpolyglutamate synthase